MTVTVIFARTRHLYDSYGDFWRLVSAAGYPVCYVDEIDLRCDAVFVTTPWNGETLPAVRAARARAGAARQGQVVWWNLERDAPAGQGVLMPDPHDFDEVWLADGHGVGFPRERHVVLGGHPDLGTPSKAKAWDVCFLAYLWGRRAEVADALRALGVSVAPEAYGRAAQDRHVAASRLMVNLLQHATVRVAAPLRFAVAASYGLPILSEDVLDPSPLVPGRDFFMVPIGEIPAMVQRMLADDDLLIKLATSLRMRLTYEHRFDIAVDRAAMALRGAAS